MTWKRQVAILDIVAMPYRVHGCALASNAPLSGHESLYPVAASLIHPQCSTFLVAIILSGHSLFTDRIFGQLVVRNLMIC